MENLENQEQPQEEHSKEQRPVINPAQCGEKTTRALMSFAFLPRSLVTTTSGFERDGDKEETWSLKEGLPFGSRERGAAMAGGEKGQIEAMASLESPLTVTLSNRVTALSPIAAKSSFLFHFLSFPPCLFIKEKTHLNE